MKSIIRPTRFVFASMAVAAAVGLWSAPPVCSAESSSPEKMEAGMKMSCESMKERHQKMRAEMMSEDTEMVSQVAAMNRAPKSEKPGMMAAALTRLVEQRMSRDARRAGMEEEMMGHMMEHMKMGGDSMSQCPMMKGKHGAGTKDKGAHTEHHDSPK
jgi:hypothetical protein